MRRRPSYRAIHTHLSYTVDELARATGVCKATVRRWLKAGLPAITDMRPALIVGADVIAFLRQRRRSARRCKLGELFCFACREPRRPAYGEAEIARRPVEMECHPDSAIAPGFATFVVGQFEWPKGRRGE